jgi:iron complex transport system ATP-binding protein
MLRFDDVRFAFDRGAPVLAGVTLGVRAGGMVAVLGPNGSGKTTLLRLASGALAPGAGRVTLDGRDVGSFARRDLARRLAVVPQETALAFDYSALEVVLMGRYPHLGAFEIEGPADLAAAERAMGATGTAAFMARPFRTLSGGEKQRVVIASALAQLDTTASPAHGGPERGGSTPLLLLDEPTASLDIRYQLEIMALLRRLHDEQGVTIVLTTHDLRLARALCTEAVLLARGRVLASGAPAEVLSSARLVELFEVDAALALPFLG